MKKIRLLLFFGCLSINSFALNITIIESTPYTMDATWSTVATSMGHSPTIVPQTTLNSNAFFATTDVLIVSSGVAVYPANQIATILAFLQTGKPVYLQCEYQSSYDSNQGFASIISSLGGTFTWTTTMAGDLHPMNVLGNFATANNTIDTIGYFWYSVPGTGDCNTIPFLEFNNAQHGWQYVPANPAWGNIVATTDQDWVQSNTSLPLMENIITNMINPLFNAGPGGSVNLGNDTTICNGSQLVLNATSANGSYVWQDNSTNPTYTVSLPGTYYVAVTGPCGNAFDTIVVNFAPAPVFDLGNDTTLCQGNPVVLDATTSSATYQWSNNTTNPTLTVSSSGIYWANVTVNGCSRRDSVQVNFLPLPSVNFGNDTGLCSGNQLVLNAGSSGSTYLWQNNSTASTFTVTVSGTYFVNVTNSCGTAHDTIVVNYNAPPVLNLGNDTSLCQGQQLILNATTANATYQWSNNTTNPTLSVSTSGSYWANITVGGCNDIDSIQVTFISAPVVNLGNDITLCSGQSATLNGGNANSYLWSTNATTQTISVNTAGTYFVQLSNGTCSASDSIQVTVNSPPAINLGPDFSLCLGQVANLNAGPATNYLWSDGSTGQSITVGQSGTYWVIAGNAQCSSVDSVVVTSEDCSVVLILPNVFTPNGDGSNDPFTPVAIRGISGIQTSIYNRWGELIFNSDNPSINWDGKTANGAEAVDGVYYWIVNYTDLLGKNSSQQGFVTLVR
jgi:gliding motility-associated-like protein